MGEIREAGASFVTISPALPQFTGELIAKRRFGFDILHDEGNEVAAAYGLRYPLPGDVRKLYTDFGIDLAEANGEDSWTLPMPARYVVGPDGVIRHARVGADYTVRPEPAETLEALRAITT